MYSNCQRSFKLDSSRSNETFSTFQLDFLKLPGTIRTARFYSSIMVVRMYIDLKTN